MVYYYRLEEYRGSGIHSSPGPMALVLPALIFYEEDDQLSVELLRILFLSALQSLEAEATCKSYLRTLFYKAKGVRARNFSVRTSYLSLYHKDPSMEASISMETHHRYDWPNTHQ